MKKNLQLSLLFFLFFSPFMMIAQEAGVCGTGHSELIMQRLVANKAALAASQGQITNREIMYVPIKFHIIGKSDGSLGISEKKVLEQLCSLNDFFSDSDMHFYIKDGFNYIFADNAYSNHSTSGQIWLNNAANQNQDAINVFIPQDANTSSQSVGVTLGYYSPSDDWLVVRKADINGNSLTLAHEIGHFFAMPHPFNGWDHTPYNSGAHGNPVNQTFAPEGGYQVELVDGSNCNTAGDMICSTPADYLFFPWNGCDYTGGCMDANGELLDPDEYNIMNYFDDSCAPKYYTDEQQSLMIADLESFQRNFLDNDYTGFPGSVVGQTELVFPIDDQGSNGIDNVELNWTDAPGATMYLLEVDRLPDFTLNKFRKIVTTSNASVSSTEFPFEEGTKYYWRVFPFNPHDACMGVTQAETFIADSEIATKEIEFVNGWQIDPNPIKDNSFVNISMDSKESFEANVNLYSATGQLISTQNHIFPNGESNMQLAINNIANGLYMVSIETKEAIVNKRLVVAK